MKIRIFLSIILLFVVACGICSAASPRRNRILRTFNGRQKDRLYRSRPPGCRRQGKLNAKHPFGRLRVNSRSTSNVEPRPIRLRSGQASRDAFSNWMPDPFNLVQDRQVRYDNQGKFKCANSPKSSLAFWSYSFAAWVSDLKEPRWNLLPLCEIWA